MYNPKIWYDGDIVTSGGLNNIEQGIAQNAHDIEDLQGALGGDMESYVNDWLDSHPEVTTTVQDGAVTTAKLAGDSVTEEKLASDSVSSDKVQDGAITEAKLSDALKLKSIKDYVTPEMFGAKGDGITNDAKAIQDAFDSGSSVRFDGSKQYLITSAVNVNEGNDIDFNNCILICNGSVGLNISMPSGSQKHNMASVRICNLNIKGNESNTLIYWDNVLKSTIENIRFYDFGIGFDFKSGYETYGNNLRFIGSNPTCIGMRSNGGDSYFYNIIMRDCHTGLHIQSGSNKYYNFHAWIYNPEYYENSCMVLDESAGGTRQEFYNPYFDTYHYCYKRTGLSTVFLHQPLLFNNYNITDQTSIETANFLHLTYSDSDKPYANRIYVDELITQLGLSKQIYDICNKTDLRFRLTYVVASQATIDKINQTSVFDVYDDVSIKDITNDFIALDSDCSLVHSKVYKQGSHIFGNIIINCPSGFASEQIGLGTLKYRPTVAVNSGCFLSSSEWSIDGYCYLYMDVTLAIKPSVSGMTYAKINVDYVCR